MTPSYLQNQLDQSLRNMGVECVDVYYIHNPESQLGHVSESEFYNRLGSRLNVSRESPAGQAGVLWCGNVEWFSGRAGFRRASFARPMVEIARAVGGDEHGFRFIQLPFNLAMPEALTLATEELGGQSIAVLEGRPSMSYGGCECVDVAGPRRQRTPDEVRQSLGSLPTDAQTAIQFVRSTPGITTALVGMSSVEHVEENRCAKFSLSRMTLLRMFWLNRTVQI
jgi:hypothetical protein